MAMQSLARSGRSAAASERPGAALVLDDEEARAHGGEGGHQLLSALQQVSNAKIHLMGYSFAASSSHPSSTAPMAKALARPINSLALVQGAMSLWSYADQVSDPESAGLFSQRARAGSSADQYHPKSRHDTAVASCIRPRSGWCEG
jgi:hypothetical protein